MPRGVKNAATTVEAVNGPEYDRLTPGYEDEEALTNEREGRYKVITPRAASFTAYEVRFIEGIGRTDDLAVAEKLKAEFNYKIIDTQKPGQRVPIPEPLPEIT
jgi:hypothetical protein